MTIVIEKGIPVPECGTMTTVFAAMEVGDSFAVPRAGKRGNGVGCKVQNVVSVAARKYVKKQNPAAKFTVRIVDENTVRCWRIA